jgi:3-hydroxymyristoyl/3-hydroxydecanoyl-(acyl carrier protein) dehydratase
VDRNSKILAPLNHPSYDGHFPGNPVVPGVVLLELIVEAMARGAPRSLSRVKFQRAVKPGEAIELAWESIGDSVSFRCERGGELLAEGVFGYGAPP